MSEFNLINFEHAVRANNRLDRDIDSKVATYKAKLEKEAKDIITSHREQVKSLIGFLKKLNIGYLSEWDDEPDSVGICKDSIEIEWNGYMCQMGPCSGLWIKIYHKAFGIPVEQLKTNINGGKSLAGIIEIEETDVEYD